MNRTNLVLLLALVALVAAYFLTAEKPGGGGRTPAAPRLFPAFNKEAADRIVVEGGWSKTRYEFERDADGWKLASAGGYPAKRESVDKVLDATWNLMQENPAGSSADLQKQTQTDDLGRTVRVFQGKQPMAEFRVGRNPKSNYEEVFVRKEGAAEVYRSRTVLTSEKNLVSAGNDPFSLQGRGFDWHNNLLLSGNDWVEKKIWDLAGAEVQEIQLAREGVAIDIARKGQEEWELRAPEAGPADTDAVNGIASAVRDIDLADVLGKASAVAAQYGLDKPEISVVVTMRKKVEKKEEPKPAEGEAPAPGKPEETKPEEKKPDEYVTFKRFLNVGKPVKRAESWDDEEGKVREGEYYPVSIGGDTFENAEERARAEFVFLVRDWKVSSLRKKLEELRQKPPEKPPEEPAKEEPAKEEPAKEEPAKEEPAKEEPGEAKPGETPKEEAPKPPETPTEPPKEPEAPPAPPETPELPKDPPKEGGDAPK